MPIFCLQVKFVFGDWVRFRSPTQPLEGAGRVCAITIDESGRVDYTLETDQGDGRSVRHSGIPEGEIIGLDEIRTTS